VFKAFKAFKVFKDPLDIEDLRVSLDPLALPVKLETQVLVAKVQEAVWDNKDALVQPVPPVQLDSGIKDILDSREQRVQLASLVPPAPKAPTDLQVI
jgi:hypothetical protein